MTFDHLFECDPTEVTYFALTYPFSYNDCQCLLENYENVYKDHPKIYFHRELLTRSIEGRRIDLLTITMRKSGSELEESIPGLFPEDNLRPIKFNKPTIFVTARVHPGETQGSYMMNGVLKFLLNEYLAFRNIDLIRIKKPA